jgi:hypothetical protein
LCCPWIGPAPLPHITPDGCFALRLFLLLWQQVPQRQIVHDILNVLDPVLEPIAPTAQAVVLEVENLEACMQVLNELVDQQRTLVVAESDSIASEAGL